MKKAFNIVMIVVFSFFNTIFLPWNVFIVLEQSKNHFQYTNIEMAFLYPLFIFILSIVPLILNTILMIFSKKLKTKLANLIVTLIYVLQLVLFFGIIFIICLN